ncbi:hypothetical protein TcasGA2_TC007048 [Tribolium castaneum]|uniref:Uncharacterized protein n=1 Tax=Tribolium castaneum TaxID=7070 RepID=D2A231_TRICA|nr:hypothetical protein TcasGA2_TC007048 [Tribolium castaneum]
MDMQLSVLLSAACTDIKSLACNNSNRKHNSPVKFHHRLTILAVNNIGKDITPCIEAEPFTHRINRSVPDFLA